MSTGPRVEWADLGADRLYLERFGDPAAPAVVFVHGKFGSHLNFPRDRLCEPLAADHHVVVFDRSGAGRSQRTPRRAYTIEDHAAVTARLLAHLGLRRPLVVGHSLGAAIALCLARDHAATLAGLVLVAPLAFPVVRGAQLVEALLRPRWLGGGLLPVLARPFARALCPRVVPRIFAPDPVPPEFLDLPRRLSLTAAPFRHEFHDQSELHRSLARLVPAYPDLTLPVSILEAEQDRVIPGRQGSRLAQVLPAARLEVVAAAGHMLQVMHAPRVCAAVRAAAEKA